jgi:5-hydroxyisourate hydrolase
MARVTTHVLDTSRGVPGAGIRIELYAIGETRRLIGAVTTDRDGRAEPAGAAGEIDPGVYELVFHAGAYFARAHVDLPTPPFIDEVTVRFGVAEANGRYHVPLLVSPWSYATYRGS